VAVRDAELGDSDLDQRTLALIKLAAMIAVDAPPVSFAWQVENAIDLGATPEQILDVLRAVASQVGAPKVVAAAPEIMLGLGLPLPGDPE
jgi:4-carboxymuconolactone decarboxylase